MQQRSVKHGTTFVVNSFFSTVVKIKVKFWINRQSEKVPHFLTGSALGPSESVVMRMLLWAAVVKEELSWRAKLWSGGLDQDWDKQILDPSGWHEPGSASETSSFIREELGAELLLLLIQRGQVTPPSGSRPRTVWRPESEVDWVPF